MKRGELWTVSGGTYAQKPRPALIVQDDLFAESASITLLPLISQLTGAPLLRLTVDRGAVGVWPRAHEVVGNTCGFFFRHHQLQDG
ncbi:type II toxin-antitoxin system PemK/MazF family toxin [Pseudarthrobacter siccitolerans]|uniref:type II toxin-antitoxin system PemK/MazF family toxin n=1 Tax=Pseudarthrobacter siccitolerans TaxID=861266 RepID=UPI000679C911